jgi:hypothetical protein
VNLKAGAPTPPIAAKFPTGKDSYQGGSALVMDGGVLNWRRPRGTYPRTTAEQWFAALDPNRLSIKNESILRRAQSGFARNQHLEIPEGFAHPEFSFFPMPFRETSDSQRPADDPNISPMGGWQARQIFSIGRSQSQ